MRFGTYINSKYIRSDVPSECHFKKFSKSNSLVFRHGGVLETVVCQRADWVSLHKDRFQQLKSEEVEDYDQNVGAYVANDQTHSQGHKLEQDAHCVYDY